MEAAVNKVCGVCGSFANQKCSGCEDTYYCSRQHQKQDWKTHVQGCRAFKIATDPVLGRHYIASRNIKWGEVILKERVPLVAGPMNSSPAVCLSCYVILQASSAKPCVDCGWPLCPDCKTHGSECQFTRSRKDTKVRAEKSIAAMQNLIVNRGWMSNKNAERIITSNLVLECRKMYKSIAAFGLPHPSYNCINVVRALSLKESNPEAYKRLLSLENHLDLMKLESDSKFGSPVLILGLMKRLFRIGDISDDEIMKIIGVLQVNGHEVPVTEPPHMAVYDLASMLEHNCRANCGKSFTEDGGLIIHAAKPIIKGEHISISYTDPLWGATNRRHHLLRTKFFECTCTRCQDPSELGTMYNAVKCFNSSCMGYMLPKTFMADEPDPYVCNRCSNKVPSKDIDETLERIGQDLTSIQKNSVTACRGFLKRYKDTLHENHFYNTDVNVALGQLIGEDTGLHDVSEQELVEKMAVCKKMNSLLNKIAPAEVRVRGVLLFEIHAILAEYSRRDQEGAMLDYLKESREYLVEACKLLQHEPKNLPEGKIASRGMENLERIDAMFKTLNLESAS